MRAAIRRASPPGAAVGSLVGDVAMESIFVVPIGLAAYFGYKWWGIAGAIGLPFAATIGLYFVAVGLNGGRV